MYSPSALASVGLPWGCRRIAQGPPQDLDQGLSPVVHIYLFSLCCLSIAPAYAWRTEVKALVADDAFLNLPEGFKTDLYPFKNLIYLGATARDIELNGRGDNIWDRSRRVAGFMRSVGTRLASNNRDLGAITYEMGLLCNYLSEISDPFNSWRVPAADDNIHDAYELDVWTHIQEVPRSSGGISFYKNPVKKIFKSSAQARWYYRAIIDAVHRRRRV